MLSRNTPKYQGSHHPSARLSSKQGEQTARGSNRGDAKSRWCTSLVGRTPARQCCEPIGERDHEVPKFIRPLNDEAPGAIRAPLLTSKFTPGKTVGEAYRRHFGRHYPAMALLEVSRLFDPEAKVELMAIAVAA